MKGSNCILISDPDVDRLWIPMCKYHGQRVHRHQKHPKKGGDLVAGYYCSFNNLHSWPRSHFSFIHSLLCAHTFKHAFIQIHYWSLQYTKQCAKRWGWTELEHSSCPPEAYTLIAEIFHSFIPYMQSWKLCNAFSFHLFFVSATNKVITWWLSDESCFLIGITTSNLFSFHKLFIPFSHHFLKRWLWSCHIPLQILSVASHFLQKKKKDKFHNSVVIIGNTNNCYHFFGAY